MNECDFCGAEFESEQELHLHWREEHGDELNSHQEDKVKKAERKKQEEKEAQMRRYKEFGIYAAGAVVTIAIIGFVGAQVMKGGGSSTASFPEGSLEGQPMLGNPNASVTVVEFGDYRCPFCSEFETSVFPRLKQNYIDTGQVKFYFVNYAFLDANFPGRSSQRAAVAGECVYDQEQEQFWDFHAAVYENQGPESQDWATTNRLMEIARDSTEGLDYGELRSCIEDSETAGEVRSDRQLGQQIGVSGTPAVYVNGQKASNWQYSSLRTAIERELD